MQTNRDDASVAGVARLPADARALRDRFAVAVRVGKRPQINAAEPAEIKQRRVKPHPSWSIQPVLRTPLLLCAGENPDGHAVAQEAQGPDAFADPQVFDAMVVSLDRATLRHTLARLACCSRPIRELVRATGELSLSKHLWEAFVENKNEQVYIGCAAAGDERLMRLAQSWVYQKRQLFVTMSNDFKKHLQRVALRNEHVDFTKRSRTTFKSNNPWAIEENETIDVLAAAYLTGKYEVVKKAVQRDLEPWEVLYATFNAFCEESPSESDADKFAADVNRLPLADAVSSLFVSLVLCALRLNPGGAPYDSMPVHQDHPLPTCKPLLTSAKDRHEFRRVDCFPGSFKKFFTFLSERCAALFEAAKRWADDKGVAYKGRLLSFALSCSLELAFALLEFFDYTGEKIDALLAAASDDVWPIFNTAPADVHSAGRECDWREFLPELMRLAHLSANPPPARDLIQTTAMLFLAGLVSGAVLLQALEVLNPWCGKLPTRRIGHCSRFFIYLRSRNGGHKKLVPFVEIILMAVTGDTAIDLGDEEVKNCIYRLFRWYDISSCGAQKCFFWSPLAVWEPLHGTIARLNSWAEQRYYKPLALRLSKQYAYLALQHNQKDFLIELLRVFPNPQTFQTEDFILKANATVFRFGNCELVEFMQTLHIPIRQSQLYHAVAANNRVLLENIPAKIGEWHERANKWMLKYNSYARESARDAEMVELLNKIMLGYKSTRA